MHGTIAGDRTILALDQSRITAANAGNVAQTDLHLQAFIDDAAVVYLNGEEVWRTNLPGGEIRHDILATSEVGDPAESAVIQISSDSLVLGNNVIAVEVHQAMANDSDMAIALDLLATEHPVDPNIQ